MTPATSIKLNKINSDFYNKVAKSFDSSRQYSWHGWDILWQYLQEDHFCLHCADNKTREEHLFKILDVGCGNGRFLDFIFKQIQDSKSTIENGIESSLSQEIWNEILFNAHIPDILYDGIDNNSFLLDIAKHKFSSQNVLFMREDFINNLIESQPIFNTHNSYDLISVFGVMHHIPGFNNRVSFLQKISKMLTIDGELCLSIWSFLDDDKYKNKIIPWTSFSIEESEIEKNDYLLPWSRGEKAVRYCHYINDEEIFELIHSANLLKVKQYEADGKSKKLNKYFILKKAKV